LRWRCDLTVRGRRKKRRRRGGWKAFEEGGELRLRRIRFFDLRDEIRTKEKDREIGTKENIK